MKNKGIFKVELTVEHLKLMLEMASASKLMPGASTFHLIESLEVSEVMEPYVEHTIKLYAVPEGDTFDPRKHEPARILKSKKSYSDETFFRDFKHEATEQVVSLNVTNVMRDVFNNYFIKIAEDGK